MSDQHRYTTAEYTYVEPGKGTVNLPNFDPEIDGCGKEVMDVMVMGYDTSIAKPVPDWPSDKSDPEGFIRLGKKLFKYDDVNDSTSVTLEDYIIDPMAYSGIRTYLIQIRGKDNALKEFQFVTNKNDQSKLVPGNGAAEKKQVQKNPDSVSENTESPDQNNRTLAEAQSSEPSQAAQADIPPKEEVSVTSSGSAPGNKAAAAAATPAPASGGSSKIAMITAAAIAGIAVLGAGGWFLLSMLNAKPEYRPYDLGEAGRTDSEIISGCLSSKPADADLQSLLAQSMKNGRCEIVLRLLRTKGRADDGGNYAYIYSVYADPSSQYSNECINKNDSDHQYWAQRVKDNKSFNPEAAQKVLEQIAQ